MQLQCTNICVVWLRDCCVTRLRDCCVARLRDCCIARLQVFDNEERLGSVAGPVIQATGRSEFEDGLGSHSGGNDRFCARLKTDISAFSSGLQGHLTSCLTILDSSRRPLSKNARHDLVRPRRPELKAEMSVFNLAQKRSFPPLWVG
jgi:hypothetical protein